VEVWSHVMRSAHQGVAVAGLPELNSGISLASILPGGGAPVPPAPVSPAPTRSERNTSLDGWFLDHWFGRR
jgi:penicillin-binding protein 1A